MIPLKHNLSVICASVITLISVVSLVPPTVNYVEFYRAFQKINLDISGFRFEFTDTYRGSISMNFSITNPTDYKGISVISLVFKVLLVNNTKTYQLTDGKIRVWIKSDPGKPLEPKSAIHGSFNTILDLSYKKELADLIREIYDNNGELTWCISNVSLDARFFLGRFFIPLENLTIKQYKL